jgi:hypothetical protein
MKFLTGTQSPYLDGLYPHEFETMIRPLLTPDLEPYYKDLVSSLDKSFYAMQEFKNLSKSLLERPPPPAPEPRLPS